MSTQHEPTDLIIYLRTKPTLYLVGASNDPHKYGNRIFRTMRSMGYEVVPINHKAQEVESVTAYPDLRSAREVYGQGLVVYVVPPSITLESLKEAKDVGLDRVWVQPGAGDEEVAAFLKSNEFAYLINACVMVEG